jgi:hypothetical protein
LQLPIFIIIARLLNWITWSLYTIGEKMYIRKYAHEDAVSSSMGFVATTSEIIWSIGVAIWAIILYKTTIPLYYLFLAIIPTALYAVTYIRKLPNTTVWDTPIWSRFDLLIWWYKDLKKNFRSFSPNLKTYTIMYFFLTMIEELVGLVIPIYIYLDTNNIFLVILSWLLLNAPNMFSYQLWKLADKLWKRSLIVWFLALSMLCVLFIVLPSYWLKISVLLLLSSAFVFLNLTVDSLSNKYIDHDMYGRSESLFEVIRALGGIIGPVIWGIYLDIFWVPSMFAILAVGWLLAWFWLQLRHNSRKNLPTEDI